MHTGKVDPRAILIVGHVNIDRSWSVGPASPFSTSQAHYGVVPDKIVHPASKAEMLGSAATIDPPRKTVPTETRKSGR